MSTQLKKTGSTAKEIRTSLAPQSGSGCQPSSLNLTSLTGRRLPTWTLHVQRAVLTQIATRSLRKVKMETRSVGRGGMLLFQAVALKPDRPAACMCTTHLVQTARDRTTRHSKE
eukprot:3578936-Amphidinium_carterae.1